MLYQCVDGGGGFFTAHGQPSKQLRLVRYIFSGSAMSSITIRSLSAAASGARAVYADLGPVRLVVISLIALMIWY